MKQGIKEILPLILISAVCYVGVELFYFGIDRFIFNDKTVAEHAVEPSVAKNTQIQKQTGSAVDYSSITRRNLFGPPPVKKTVGAKPAEVLEELEATTLELVLMGTIFVKDDSGRAIILTKKDRKQELYRVGDQIQGAVVKEIRRGNVILTVDGQDEKLDMSEAGKYAPRGSTSPVAANLPRRLPAVLPGPESQESSVSQTRRVRPRVVRPSRKIVSSRRAAVPVASQDDEVEQDDVPEDVVEEEAADEERMETPPETPVEE